jgi:hypothetical protein
MRILCLTLCLALTGFSTAHAQEKGGGRKPVPKKNRLPNTGLHKGKNLQQWLDRAYVEKPESPYSHAVVAIQKLDPTGKYVKRQCLKLILQGNEFERVAASNVLWRAYKDTTKGLEALTTILKTGKKQKSRAITTLSMMGDVSKAAIPTIAAYAAKDCPERSFALEALERYGVLAKAQLPIVEAALKDPKIHLEDKLYAARAYWLISGDESKILSYLKTVLTDKELAPLVNRTLENLGEKALPIWQRALDKMPEGPNASFRIYAIERLGVKSISYLERVLKADRKERVKRDVVMCLGRLATHKKKPVDSAIPLLVFALDDKHERVVHFSALYLGRLGKRGQAGLAKLDALKNSGTDQIKKTSMKAAEAIRKALAQK